MVYKFDMLSGSIFTETGEIQYIYKHTKWIQKNWNIKLNTKAFRLVIAFPKDTHNDHFRIIWPYGYMAKIS